MSNATSSSAVAQATMPSNAAPKNFTPPAADTHLSEADYLREQSQQAQRAMSQTLKLIGKNIADEIDPRIWTRTHPWASLATAAGAAFLGTAFLIPGKSSPKIPAAASPAQATEPKAESKTEEKPKPSLLGKALGGIVHQAFHLARPILMSTLVTFLNSKFGHAEQPPAEEIPEPAVAETANQI